MAKLPAFQFYPGDWMKDPALRSCTVAARGLWTDMLCLMFESGRRGYLQHATGKPVSPDQLARMTGCSADEVSRLLQELEDSGVFSRTEHGVIYSRRMARDEGKREKCRMAGMKGGNPNLTLKGHPKGATKGHPKGGDNHSPTPSSSSSSSVDLPVGRSLPGPDKPARKVRERDPLFDAVADVTGTDPAASGSHVGKVRAALAKASPPYTADEVRDLGRRVAELMPWTNGRRPTLGEIEKYIGLVRTGQSPTSNTHAPHPRPGGDVRRGGRCEPPPGKYDHLDAAGAEPAAGQPEADLFGPA